MALERNAGYFHQEVNSLISLVFIASFIFAAGLMIWSTFSGKNPVADSLVPVAQVTEELAHELRSSRVRAQ